MTQIGREHPNPDNIPHLSSSPHNGNGTEHRGSISGIQAPNLPPPSNGAVNSGSPVKESSYLAREATNAGDANEQSQEDAKSLSISPPPKTEGVPIPGQ